MKKLLLLIVGLSLVGCGSNNSTQSESTDTNQTTSIEAEEIRNSLTELEPIPYLVHHPFTWETDRWVWQISAVDLLTGDILANYEFSEEESFYGLWYLGDGHHALWIRNNSHENYDLGHEIIILNESLEILEVISYDVNTAPWISSGFLQLEDGELVAYSFDPGSGGSAPRPIADPVRFNFHTGERAVLTEMDEPIEQMHQFVGENQVFVTEKITFIDEGRIITRYGILDLETNATHFFEESYFNHERLAFNHPYVLINESHPLPPLRSEVILFNTETMSSEFAPLEGEESIWVHFSYDGNHLVTINEELSTFRKYNFSGTLVTEVELELFSNFGIAEWVEEGDLDLDDISYGFRIIPITDQVYAVHTNVFHRVQGALLDTNHFQLVILP